VEPFIVFAKAGTFKQFGDDFVLTNGSRQAQRQLTAGDFRALLAAAGEERSMRKPTLPSIGFCCVS
jgi:hypothetical protein